MDAISILFFCQSGGVRAVMSLEREDSSPWPAEVYQTRCLGTGPSGQCTSKLLILRAQAAGPWRGSPIAHTWAGL